MQIYHPSFELLLDIHLLIIMNKLNLTVEIDAKSGFCFGVIGAIAKAEKILDNNEELYCLGEIVHNDEEVKRLQSKGLKFISFDEFKVLKNKKVLFRAHSEPPLSYEIALENNLEIIDASCPIIQKIKQKVKTSFANNENIYIYGKPKHPEVIAINGQINNRSVVFENIESLDIDNVPDEITLYSQTTQSLDDFREIIRILTERNIVVNVKDTICRQVSNRGPNMIDFCKRFNKIVFVAGTNSSNGKVLYNICKSQNANVYFISSPEQIDKTWFNAGDKVGISGATSTPLWLMKQVQECLLKL